MSPLSASAQKIQNLLTELGYDLTVIEHAESTRTAQEAADRAGCLLGQITKSLIFRGKDSGKPILVLTSGANRVDEKRIAAYAGEPKRGEIHFYFSNFRGKTKNCQLSFYNFGAKSWYC